MSLAYRLLPILAVTLLAGCKGADDAATAPAKPPATVEKLPSEEGLYKITLSPQAAARFTTGKVTQPTLPRRRTLGGEVIVPPGKTIVVAAPFAGTLSASEGKDLPQAGQRLTAGQEVFSFTPLLTPERYVPTPAESVQMANAQATLLTVKITTFGEVLKTTVEVEAAKIALRRAQELLEDKAGSERAVDEAKATLAIAEKTLEAAQERKKVLDELTLNAKTGRPDPVAIAAPLAGTLAKIAAAPGQTVAAGTALFEIQSLNTVWVRVPVYAGLLSEIEPKADATVARLRRNDAQATRTATWKDGPPSATSAAATVDIYFEAPNEDGALVPGERVTASLALVAKAASLAVPRSAVLYDIHGNTWVYEKIGENAFARRKVHVAHVDGDSAVLEHGPAAGTEVVVDGAELLFGTEFGAGK
ncbi:MAG: efflux RND transporter periplasmic adaptor subunit [Planctomycetia bacterium]|nr:efflux RND transporter periplasmic adaptor subunit [Planctomycetia bacterium]